MRHTRLVRMVCFALLAGATAGATARSSDSRFFQGWFTQADDRPAGRGDNRDNRDNRDSRGGARPGPSRPQQQPIRPQGDLRGDIYNHLREQRQPPPPASDPRQRQRDRNGR